MLSMLRKSDLSQKMCFKQLRDMIKYVLLKHQWSQRVQNGLKRSKTGGTTSTGYFYIVHMGNDGLLDQGEGQ